MPRTKTSRQREPRDAIGDTREERLQHARKAIATARGRPGGGSAARGSQTRALRLPDATWRDLEVAAKA